MILDSISNERRLGGRVTGQLEVWEEHTGSLGIIELDKNALSTTHQLWEQCNEGCGQHGQSVVGLGAPILGPLMLLARQAWGTCWLSSRERSCSPLSSSLHQSVCLYGNTALRDGGEAPDVGLHLAVQGGFLQQTVCETPHHLALVSMHSQPTGTGIFPDSTNAIPLPTV